MARTHRKALRETRAKRRQAPAPDPDQQDEDLAAQLRAMGLYAADTRGDGNCLFRALSDQLYGDPQYHAELRRTTCDEIEKNPTLYAGFVDSASSLEAYVRDMRTLGTYGGHLELSAFAHAMLKPIRIVQPGLVYVVACDDDSAAARAARARREHARAKALKDAPTDVEPARSTRRSQRATRLEPLECVGPLHIAYHSWEHYSSLRRLEGPHTGHPCIPEEEEENDRDAERLIHQSVPGHSQRTVRRLLREWGDWEAVVEELLRRDAERDACASSSPSSASSTASSPTSAETWAYSARPRRATRKPVRNRSSASPHIPELRQLTI
ncbi:ubiquitinyl hydrolase 1 [Malassezia nana]|uniref:Ubiquitinyl hydrolase 1 n=1 Tax=Malassezia nana TaxID=180528 RepID=A0AAF0EN86_9BASI|nr:ubiquitinyl hydrolase 1 [Malassezia nana]